MAENYDLIFGQSASQQYAWNDSDYQNGWQTVGSTPPTAEQFDALQRRSDTKAKDLNDRLSPLEAKAGADGRQAATSYTSGATLTVDGLPNGWLLECIVPGISGTDAITLPDTLIDGLTIVDGNVTWALRKVATNGGLGYRQPSTAYAVGDIAYHASLPTGWYLECTTKGTTGSGELDVSRAEGDTVTDGTVTWRVVNGALQSSSFGKSIVNHLLGSTLASMVDAVSTDSLFSKLLKKALEAAGLQYNFGAIGYICFGSLFGGLILQWGYGIVSANNSSAQITYPIHFKDRGIPFIMPQSGSTFTIGVDIRSTSSFTGFIRRSYEGGNVLVDTGFFWAAIGY